jgi:hypothetical protein
MSHQQQQLKGTLTEKSKLINKNNNSLSYLAAQNDKNNLELTVSLDYLGSLDIESKYLQSVTIPWFIGSLLLLERNKRMYSVFMEINVGNNLINVYKKDKTQICYHQLSNIFKLSVCKTDSLCFGYFYRENGDSFNYKLYAFYSNKSNLAQVIYDYQMKALKLHDNNFQYEKSFNFKLIVKVNSTFLSFIFFVFF